MNRRHVFTVNLKDEPGIVESYTRYHREVWPEVQDSLRHVGVERMDIYLLGRRLVMIVEMRDGLDYRTAFKSHASSSSRVIEWERLMKSLQEPPSEAQAGEWWAVMEPVFHLDHGSIEHQPGSHGRQPASRAAAARGTEERMGPEEPAIAHVADRSRTS
jgi:L-rhamnose mutarotase